MQSPLVLSATHETKSALVLVELANCEFNEKKDAPLKCDFNGWETTPYGSENSGTITQGMRRAAICLQIGSHDGVHLKEEDGAGHTFTRENGTLSVKIGKRLPETDAPSVAKKLAECLLVHCGKNQMRA